MKDKRNEIPGMNIINCRDRGFPSWGKEAKQPRYQQFWGPTQEQPVFKCPGHRRGGQGMSIQRLWPFILQRGLSRLLFSRRSGRIFGFVNGPVRFF